MNQPTRLNLFEHAVVNYHIIARAGTKPDDLLDPAYWAHVAYQLRPGHRIIVDTEDQMWTATLYVKDARKNQAMVALLDLFDMSETSDLDVTSEYEVRFRGPRKFSIIRLSDNAVIREDIATKEDAEKQLKLVEEVRA